MSKRQSIGKKLAKKAAREAVYIGKGVVKEGGKIIGGTIHGFIDVFNPFK